MTALHSTDIRPIDSAAGREAKPHPVRIVPLRRTRIVSVDLRADRATAIESTRAEVRLWRAFATFRTTVQGPARLVTVHIPLELFADDVAELLLRRPDAAIDVQSHPLTPAATAIVDSAVHAGFVSGETRAAAVETAIVSLVEGMIVDRAEAH